MAVQESLITIPNQVIEQVRKGQEAALGAIRQVVDSVDEAVPDFRPAALKDKIPARKDLIDSAFDITEKVMNAGHSIATVVTATVVSTTGNALNISKEEPQPTAPPKTSAKAAPKSSTKPAAEES